MTAEKGCTQAYWPRGSQQMAQCCDLSEKCSSRAHILEYLVCKLVELLEKVMLGGLDAL